MNANNRNGRKYAKYATMALIAIVLAPGMQGCFLDDINKLSASFKPYMDTLSEKANNPVNQELFKKAADAGEKKFQEDTQKKLGEQAASTGAPKKDF